MLRPYHFLDSSPNVKCVELLDRFTGTAVLSGYDAWANVGFCYRERISKSLINNYKEIRSAEVVDRDIFNFSARGTLCVQNLVPSQPPKIDAGKVRSLLQ